MSRTLALVVHNVRSSHNVGSILRTADGLGVKHVYLTGYTPYPIAQNDERLPHVKNRINQQIAKVSLGAEKTVEWQHEPDIKVAIDKLRKAGYEIVALEQSPHSLDLETYIPPKQVALIVGSEVGGLTGNVLGLANLIIEIPMLGKKESFNVAVAAAIALYQLQK